MIDLDRIVEQLYQHSLDAPEASKEKMKITLSLALRSQCDEISDIVCKCENKWAKTKANSFNGIEDNDVTARLIRLLFNSIHDDIKEINSNILNNTYPKNVR